jgi:hypothetical protein
MKLSIDGGDGDQSYFAHRLLMEQVERAWFRRETPRGSGLLFQIASGPHKGEYAVLTSRVQASVEEQLAQTGSASVVVGIVLDPGPNFEPTFEHLRAIGMSFADLL